MARNAPGIRGIHEEPLDAVRVPPSLELARKHSEQRAWGQSYRAFLSADQDTALQAEDLELFATAACLVGLDDDYLEIIERAHTAHFKSGNPARASRCAFWLAFRLFMRGEMGRASGWLTRAERLLEGDAHECAERGYLALPFVEQLIKAGALDEAYTAAERAMAIGHRCGDRDLIACAQHQLGKILLYQGKIDGGLAHIDETMVTVMADELSPMVTGMLYCSVIAACQQVYALDRTREWTEAMKRWCDGQEEVVAFAGVCLVHRSEVLLLAGAWTEAIQEAQRAWDISHDKDNLGAAAALYQQGEIQRLTGAFDAAEESYRGASRLGLDPQPGLALLRLAQGRSSVAVSAIRRILQTTESSLKRLGILPAYVEIMLAAGDIEEARNASHELQELASTVDTEMSRAYAAQSRGALALAEGNAQPALNALRRAFESWQGIGAPHAAARVRMLIGIACRQVGDEDAAGLEFDAARSAFLRLGARPDLDRIESFINVEKRTTRHSLTPREVQVLRHVCSGKTNAAVAAELNLSERTVERHLSNIFNKLSVSTRTAAAAWAYGHGVI